MRPSNTSGRPRPGRERAIFSQSFQYPPTSFEFITAGSVIEPNSNRPSSTQVLQRRNRFSQGESFAPDLPPRSECPHGYAIVDGFEDEFRYARIGLKRNAALFEPFG